MRALTMISPLVFCGFVLVGCDNKVPNFSPAAPSMVMPTDSDRTGAPVPLNALSGQNCGNPNDWEPDDSALQACLDRGGNINLEPGLPGYIVDGLNGDVNRGLHLTRSGTALGSSGGANRARIIAGRNLFAPILQTQGNVSSFSIRNISLDGMVDEMAEDGPYRRRRDDCIDGRSPGNVFLQGAGFQFKDNESQHAMCGTGLGLLGSGYDVQNNYISYNGRDKNSGAPGAPWADGMTVLSCEGGYIAHNVLVDNTDIDLVLGGGRGCVVELNTIAHFGKYAFAGLNIGNFNNNGDHSGSEYRGNTVYSGVADRLSMGILVGSHPWSTRVWVHNAGRVVGNTSYGNVLNLVVEGVRGGEVVGNNVYDPRGSDSGCGKYSMNYIVNPVHVTNTTLQEGWTPFQFDEWVCASIAGE